ncbi:D-hexose-6-phosphate mutarotase [Thalassotalea aquiviva]|uniref:D-hexose-6-phosphate mutarotase n=1 Tax=Thalassotalea aquiviva TaxID=3242415 RepID=UPI00352B1FE2
MQSKRDKLTIQGVGKLSLHQIKPDIEHLYIEHQKFQATISLHGGQVLTYVPRNQQPVLWLSRNSVYDNQKAIRGGIPICFPWFGPKENCPQHGFARNMLWKLTTYDMTPEQVVIKLELEGEKLLPEWPYKFQLIQTLIFADNFTQKLEVRNLDQQAFEISYALHSYFNVSNPEKTSIPDLNSVVFTEQGADDIQCSPVDVNDCVGPIDRNYVSDDSINILDSGYERVVSVQKKNSNHWVLWNPGQELANKMADVHPHGEQEYVCLEAAQLTPISVLPQETYSFEQTIRISIL